MDTFASAKSSQFERVDSPYIIFYRHFLNLNNILTLPKTFVVTEAGFDLTYIRLVFCLPDLHASC